MPRGRRGGRLFRIKEALERMPQTASEEGEADARQVLYPQSRASSRGRRQAAEAPRLRVGILLYDGFDELDALGPYEVLRNADRAGGGVEALLVTRTPSRRTVGSHGLTVEPQGKLEEVSFDMVIVPGGGWNDQAPAGAYTEAERGELPAAVRRLHDAGTSIASVCTGGMLVSAAGLLSGRPATTHHDALEELRSQGAEVTYARVVDDGDLLSCGGVTAGIDLALWIVERELGKALADGIANEMEYERRGGVWRRG